MRGRTIARIALAGLFALGLALSTTATVQAAEERDSSPDFAWDFDGTGPDWTFTL